MIEEKIKKILNANMSEYGTKREITLAVWEESNAIFASARSRKLSPEQKYQEAILGLADLREKVRGALATYRDRAFVQEIIRNLNRR